MFGPCNFFFFDSSVKKQAAVLFFSSFTLSLCRPALTCSTSHQSASASIADERHPEGTVEVGATELRRRQGGDVGGGGHRMRNGEWRRTTEDSRYKIFLLEDDTRAVNIRSDGDNFFTDVDSVTDGELRPL